MTKEVKSLVEDFSNTFGEKELEKLLLSRLQQSSGTNVLTIICDDTLHKIPSHLIEGESFVFSTGNFDTTSEDAVARYLALRTVALCEQLNSKTWKRIRLIFSGHAILAATAKLAIYRVTHLETEDVLYFGEHGYLEINLRLREVLGKADLD
jgi:hypothetical protein